MAGWGSLLSRTSLMVVSANKRSIRTAFASPLFRRSKQASPFSSAFITTTTTTSPSSTWKNFQLQATATTGGSRKRTKSTTVAKPSGGRPYRLVIVESPSKCATIEKILQTYVTEHQLDYDFVVTSCYGHIRNLPKNQQEIRNAKYLSSSSTPTSPSTITSTTATEFPYSIVGVDLEHDYQPTYVLLPGKEKLVQELQDLTNSAQHVYLATDPDREGEAIAWHLQEVLQLHHDMTERLSFTEITPTAIQAAVESPHSLNDRLVAAQETRRILDRLAGFTVSPVLWKKIAPGLSAGRVQSVGMALVVQRERERLVFTPAEYWDIQGNFSSQDLVVGNNEDDYISATLVSINETSLVAGKADFIEANETTTTTTTSSSTSKKVNGRLAAPQPKPNKRLLTETDARELVAMLEDPSTQWHVKSVQARERLSYPPEPFKTSTLQQESNQRLGLSVSQTMSTAQQLYEAGWISYMRTDATHLSEDASAATAQAVSQAHGPHYVAPSSSSPKKQSKKKKKDSASDKVAQEAHEAIRPAIQPSGNFAPPQEITSSLSDSTKSLYQLIYRRTLASRMPPQKTNQTTVVFEGTSGDTTTTVIFRTTGSVVLEPGFTLEWNRGDSSNKYLPPLEEGQELCCHDLDPQSHTTQPPPRFTEASLVKELEALGVGRPSTYAGIVRILRDRAYVGSPTSSEAPSSRDRRKTAATGAAITAQRAAGGGDLFGARGPLCPSLSAFVVTSLLEEHCPTYVDPSFTARMEENLDRIAHGDYRHDSDDDDDDDDDADAPDVAEQRVAYLNEFYAGEHGLAAQIKRIDDTVEAEKARRANLPALEPSSEDEPDVGIYIGPWGPYIQQKTPGNDKEETLKAPLPAGLATDLSSITTHALMALVEAKQTNGTVLGQHPNDGRNIRLRVGRFGAYLQWGESDEEGTTTHSLPQKLSAMRNLQTDRKESNSDREHDDMPCDSVQEQISDPSSLSGMLGITLEEAIGYCGLPRTVTTLEEKPIIASIGPYGPYLKYNNSFMSLHARDGDVLTIDEDTAKLLVTDGIVNKKPGRRGVLAELGEKDDSMVTVKSGRFGPYINWKKVNAKLPSEFVDEPDNMPLEDAWALIQEKAGSATTNSKKKKSDLPPPPKRPVSAYLHFCSEKRPEVSKEVKSLGEVSKRLASMWAETTDEERKAYHELARGGKEEYQKEKTAWEEECKKLQKTVGGRKKQTSVDPSIPAQPKRPKSAYLFFCETKRPEVAQKGLGLGDVTKELARMWADTNDRTEYVAQAEADKARYEEEKSQYESNNGAVDKSRSSVASKVQRSSSKSKGTRSSGKKNGTEKRAPSAYIIFCRETRSEIVDEKGEKLPLGETTKRLAHRWNNLDASEKAEWSEKAIEAKEKLLL